jgi:hypothetical protein
MLINCDLSLAVKCGINLRTELKMPQVTIWSETEGLHADWVCHLQTKKNDRVL